MLVPVLVCVIVLLVLFLAFISLLIITHYVSVGYQSTTTIDVPCDIWYLSGNEFSQITKVELTVAGTMKRKNLNPTECLEDLVREINHTVFLEQKNLAVFIMPKYLKDYGRIASEGSMEGITHELLRKLMKKNKTIRGRITRLRLYSDGKITTINRRKPTNFLL